MEIGEEEKWREHYNYNNYNINHNNIYIIFKKERRRSEDLPSIGEDVGKGFEGFVDNPREGRIQKTMLEKDRRSRRRRRRRGGVETIRNSKRSEDVTILSGDVMGFARIPFCFYDLCEISEGVWIY
jgi:hypothetical protein